MVINTKYNVHDNVLYENEIYKVIAIQVVIMSGMKEIVYNIANKNTYVDVVEEDELLPLPS